MVLSCATTPLHLFYIDYTEWIKTRSLFVRNPFCSDVDHSSCYFSEQVPKVTHTEFCQGRTMRWALAWSFYEDVTMPVSYISALHLL